ncbi:hypothetical protein CDAR_553511 [Caerostris darwini]|uniref:Uncharacterized protein n=1 Tax=Caerostris darwini TaxID=1538125 RepID=A0AAV4SDT4_9ARAC|nr:hypothetical protein CDAR_553511 [Caerostris darwini]
MLLHDELKECLPESFNLVGLAIGVIERELNHFLTSSYEVEENSGTPGIGYGILLLSEMSTILRDTFELNGFVHNHLVSDLSRQKPGSVSIYLKLHLKPFVDRIKMFPNQDLEIYVLVANFKTKKSRDFLVDTPVRIPSQHDLCTRDGQKRLASRNNSEKGASQHGAVPPKRFYNRDSPGVCVSATQAVR